MPLTVTTASSAACLHTWQLYNPAPSAAGPAEPTEQQYRLGNVGGKNTKKTIQSIGHGDQSLQGSRVQLRSQETVSHARSSVGVSHSLPLFFGMTMMLRVLVFTPPSQSLVHVDDSDHRDITQSTVHLI